MKSSLTEVLRSRTLFLASILAGSLIFSQFAQAAEKTDTPMKIPATSEAIWNSIDNETVQLATLLKTGQLAEVHHHAYAIRDLVAALPARSASLQADQLAQVKANSKFIATLAERLDAAGDARDKAGVESSFQKLNKVLATIRVNYPGSTRK